MRVGLSKRSWLDLRYGQARLPDRCPRLSLVTLRVPLSSYKFFPTCQKACLSNSSCWDW